ncbi:MAG TPA: glucose 1-dehydrogenase [Polyangiaceae bacterium]|nr:glucose 1-dehydrogenase [Polyangiaceae bacterium]
MTEHRVGVVTGGAHGIGLAVAKALAREGLAVVIGDVDEEAGRAGAEAIRAAGGQAISVRTDVTVPEDARALVELTVREFGRLDCAVNNAGVNIAPTAMAEIDDESWDRLFAINVRGVRNCMRAEIAHMLRAGKGSIVNMGSTLGLVGGRQCAAYVASKHAVVGLTKAAALDYAKAGIRINAVCPGPVATRMMSVALKDDAKLIEGLRADMPNGRFIEADEVAQAAVWLGSPAASGLFGHCLLVDGAWTAV